FVCFFFHHRCVGIRRTIDFRFPRKGRYVLLRAMSCYAIRARHASRRPLRKSEAPLCLLRDQLDAKNCLTSELDFRLAPNYDYCAVYFMFAPMQDYSAQLSKYMPAAAAPVISQWINDSACLFRISRS